MGEEASIESAHDVITFSNIKYAKQESFVSFSLDPNTNQATILITLTTQQEEFPSAGLTGALQSQLMETGMMFGLRVLEITRRGEC